MPHDFPLSTPLVPARSAWRLLVALCCYAALLVYGSLYPFSHWQAPALPAMAFLLHWPAHLDKADVLQNVLVYAPFGLLAALWLAGRMQARPAALLATIMGTALSMAMECLQQFNPARVASLVDIAMNALGSGLGALLAGTMLRHTLSGALALAWRDRWFRHGALANTGLVIAALWLLSQTSPLVPTLDVSHLRRALSGLWHALHDPRLIVMTQLLTYACLFSGMGALILLLARPGKPALRLFALTVLAMLMAKALIVGRVLSLEACAGAGLALLASLLLRTLPLRILPWTGMLMIVLGFAIAELAPGPPWMVAEFNWTLFTGQMRSVAGLSNILELLWLFMALAWFMRIALPNGGTRRIALVGAVLTAVAVFALEWQQQFHGRYGDITQVMLCVAGWIIPWCVPAADRPLDPPI
ncbi:VanZ family protein|uniref:VanZ family protein n=1 Tax=Noviherbaspirillum sp. L7-7A TaxID=2850560 RepID=UPI001C2C94CC|nr:VanZ family protein [Noviherbaspirillum sp. L7-7A]MBV0879097.1 VanZ family protein [Noviherbaspirillum sp. L7-7A]